MDTRWHTFVVRARGGRCWYRRDAAETRPRHTGPVHITRADFDDPRLAAFLQAHLDDMEPTAPPESRHALDLTGLQKPGVRLWVALDGDAVIGTAALAPVEQGWEELKSMRTAPDRRGEGIAAGMLEHVLADARARGVG